MLYRWLGLLPAVLLAACASRMSADSLPSGSTLNTQLKLPTTATVGIYLPANYRNSRFMLGRSWVLPGRALEDSVKAVAQHFFAGNFLVDNADDRRYGLLIAIQPEWAMEHRQVRMTMSYRVYGQGKAMLLEGKQSFAADVGDLRSSDSLFNAALRSSQLVMVDVVNRLSPSADKYPALAQLRDLEAEAYIRHDKPVSSGTGFFINANGQVMTAAHVLHDCALVEVRREDKIYPARVLASSPLLDLAVLETGIRPAKPLPLRQGQDLQLGEPVVNVGFPLQPILASSPSLTRGNLSSRSALSGSLSEFQFSAPIQPGSSGGPVVSDGGELLGVTLATLNPTPLIEKGILPQNVNFALDARYAAMFLRRSGVSFNEVPANPHGDMQTGNQAALSAAVAVACYQ